MPIEVNGTTLETDNEGFLLDPSEWDLDVARELARGEQLEMSDAHWTVVRFVRDWFEYRHAVPEARHALKDLRHKLGEEKATRKFLYSLFPYGYGQQACKIAGMRKPLKLMLDI
jgi:TusE/DsrC/DsvC family sulfur relay protein